MAIQFVVETGAALSNATSYVSIAEYKQYYENRGIDYTAVADATIQAKLNIATEYIDNNYTFSGRIVDEDQALCPASRCYRSAGPDLPVQSPWGDGRSTQCGGREPCLRAAQAAR